MHPILLAENLLLTRNGRQILQVDTFRMEPGEPLALIGPNGAGKSSLLLTLALLQPLTSGKIFYEGSPVTSANVVSFRRKIAVVFQESLLLDLSVIANITTALKIRGASAHEARMRAMKWLERFGILPLAKQPARVLSGGEAQRASLARAFALDPAILFLDEPFASLDYPSRNTLLEDLGEVLKAQRTSTLFVTHDYTEIPYIAERVAVIFEGRIIKSGTVSDIFGDELASRKAWAPWE